ncbi:uncharacterized protein LOC130666849 [Microplitis mediator]|uniref:uncharacterized protein LOC130666849 n=1 Tax=Microplitis mediator TaxID=375433 RepID=UPI00255611B0|nr:uncharacterized protein LOC130666849 [Microplitis mediator]XP_057324145.1 uncharacterized protein LOC130666849 [Microplitis mediator]XP_057324146.1 uncharacterized protein LOC130666849 [Microplitis mediator]XP_057324147.1 uncharacterized protein LOC130666849 [Microplitis mediator]XP_057324148.1 uncharacterized protein LOC130666849 [Microplitis mediator]XP_057324149.1 uncharacterized protein LOC130666849 [Microplitis mediator]XP_057324150.1 uncharacterized protein LOC130666849 [Microplitis 
MKKTMEMLESQLHEKNGNERRQAEQINELTEKNLKLESDMIKRIKQLTEMMSKNIQETESNGGMVCGYEDTKVSKVYLGPDVWIDSRTFKSLLRNNKYSLFVKQLCRYLFGEETLKKSTVTGKTSNRKIKLCKDKEEEVVTPEQLDPILISIVRDSLKYYFRYKGVTDQFKIDDGLASIPRLIAVLSSDLKKIPQQPGCKKTPKATDHINNKENHPDNIESEGHEKISGDEDSHYDTDYDSDIENDTDHGKENNNDNEND